MQASSPKIEDGLCLYAIGDIHGHKDKLQQIMAAIIEDARQQRDEIKRLVFLGDYIDRGPDSKGVIEYLLHDLPPSYQTVFIRGNHEDVLLRILNGETERIASWMPFGAAACFTSYGVNPFRPYLRETPEILQAELSHQMPPDHLQFLEDTLLSHVSGDYYFVHAGVRPNIALSQQDTNDLLWIRDEFLTSKKDFGKIVVHGHSISEKPDIQINRIGIDTGAYATGKLTALKLRGCERQFFTT